MVFASKFVGTECSKYLIDQDAPISVIIAGSKDDRKLIDYAKSKGVEVKIYCKGLQNQMVCDGNHFDWLLNLWSPHILRNNFLSAFNHRLNAHPTLVPYCRGNDGTAWTIRNNFPAGVSLIEIRQEIDAGEVYCQKEVDYHPLLTTGRELHQLLQMEMINLFKCNWPKIYKGEIKTQAQVGNVFSYKRKDTEFDRKRSSIEQFSDIETVIRWINGHDFSPGTSAEIAFKGEKYKLRLDIEKIKEAKNAS